MSKYNYDIFEPVNEYYIIIDWAPVSLCNFSCNYCNPDIYSGISPQHNFEDAKRFLDFLWNNLCVPKNKKMFFNVHGGEPTLWKQLDKFCEYIKHLDSGNLIRLLTNGTRSTQWWLDRSGLIDMVIVSVHQGQSKNQEIVEKFSQLYDNKIDVSLHVMMDQTRFDDCIETYNYLYDNLNGPHLVYKPLRITISHHELQPYTPEQQAAMKQLTKKDGFKKHHPQQSQMQWRSTLDNSTKIINNIERELLLTHENDWQDWYCNIGMETVVVNHRGNIKLGSLCFKRLTFGNIADEEYQLPLIPIKCKFKYCGCITDLQTTKVKNLEKGKKYIDAQVYDSTYKITTRD